MGTNYLWKVVDEYSRQIAVVGNICKSIFRTVDRLHGSRSIERSAFLAHELRNVSSFLNCELNENVSRHVGNGKTISHCFQREVSFFARHLVFSFLRTQAKIRMFLSSSFDDTGFLFWLSWHRLSSDLGYPLETINNSQQLHSDPFPYFTTLLSFSLSILHNVCQQDNDPPTVQNDGLSCSRRPSVDFGVPIDHWQGSRHGALWPSTKKGRFSLWNDAVRSHVTSRMGYQECLGYVCATTKLPRLVLIQWTNTHFLYFRPPKDHAVCKLIH